MAASGRKERSDDVQKKKSRDGQRNGHATIESNGRDGVLTNKFLYTNKTKLTTRRDSLHSYRVLLTCSIITPILYKLCYGYPSAFALKALTLH